jgi:hypothetical protein
MRCTGVSGSSAKYRDCSSELDVIPVLFLKVKAYMTVERGDHEGELGGSPAERTLSVDPLNLTQVILAEGIKNE